MLRDPSRRRRRGRFLLLSPANGSDADQGSQSRDRVRLCRGLLDCTSRSHLVRCQLGRRQTATRSITSLVRLAHRHRRSRVTPLVLGGALARRTRTAHQCTASAALHVPRSLSLRAPSGIPRLQHRAHGGGHRGRIANAHLHHHSGVPPALARLRSSRGAWSATPLWFDVCPISASSRRLSTLPLVSNAAAGDVRGRHARTDRRKAAHPALRSRRPDCQPRLLHRLSVRRRGDAPADSIRGDYRGLPKATVSLVRDAPQFDSAQPLLPRLRGDA